MVVGSTYAISAYHHKSCEFESCWWRGVLDTTLWDKVCQMEKIVQQEKVTVPSGYNHSILVLRHYFPLCQHDLLRYNPMRMIYCESVFIGWHRFSWCLLILIESSVYFYHNIVSYLSTSLLFSICYEIIINRGLLIFVDFSVHLNHEN
jgi:hypothetical protein